MRLHNFDNGLTYSEIKAIKPWSSFEAEDVGYQPRAHIAYNQFLRLEKAPFWRKIHFPSVYLEHKNALLLAEYQRVTTLYKAYETHWRLKTAQWQIAEEVAMNFRDAAYEMFSSHSLLYEFLKDMHSVTKRCTSRHGPCDEFYWTKMKDTRDNLLPAGKKLFYAERILEVKREDFRDLQAHIDRLQKEQESLDTELAAARACFNFATQHESKRWNTDWDLDGDIEEEWNNRKREWRQLQYELAWPPETKDGLSGGYRDREKTAVFFDKRVTDKDGIETLTRHGIETEPQEREDDEMHELDEDLY